MTRAKAKPQTSTTKESNLIRTSRLRARKEHSQETAQDYAELIAEMIETVGEARLSEIAKRMGVSHVTASRIIGRLQREGFVTSKPYRSIFLTEQGSKLAKESRYRHEIVFKFLKSLGVSEKVAQSDSEGIEHHVSPETLSAFRKLIQDKKGSRSKRSSSKL